MKKSQLLSAAVSGLFFASTSFAQTAKTTAPAGAAPAATAATGECHGANACKGQGACGGKGHECAGKNACKGKGFTKMTKDDCTTAAKANTDKKVHIKWTAEKADKKA